MRSTITALFSLAAVASSVVVPPRADYGFWDFNGVVTYPVSGYNSIIIDASYHNTELANPVNVHCEWHYHQRDQSESAFCTDPSFTYDVSSIGPGTSTGTISLSQTVGLWGSNVTLSGSKEIKFDFSGGAGFSGESGNETIDVKTAVA